MKLGILAGFCLALFFMYSVCAANDESINFAYPANGVKLGQGWDSFLDQGTSASCVEVTPSPLEQTSFQTTMELIQSSYSLITKTTTSVSAAYHAVTGGGASGHVGLSHDQQINSDDQNFLFTFESSNGSEFAVAPANAKTGIRLTEDALKLSPSDFEKICGQGFVAAIHRGTRIQVLLTQHSASLKDRQSLEATLSASGYGASVGAYHSSSTERFTKTDHLSYRVFQQGGKPFGAEIKKEKDGSLVPPFPNPDSLLDTNSQKPNTNPQAFQVTIEPYSNLLPGRQSLILPSPIKMLTLGDYYLALNDLYSMVSGILTAELNGTDADEADAPFDRRVLAIYAGAPMKDGKITSEGAKQIAEYLEGLRDNIFSDLQLLEEAIVTCYKERKPCAVDESMVAAVNMSLALNESEMADLQSENSTDPMISARETVLRERSERYKRLIAGKKLNEEFFLDFYVYLTQIPPPQVAYSDNSELRTLKDVVIPAAQVNEKIKELKNQLSQVILAYRLLPWKDFFCAQQKNSVPLCRSDANLREIAYSVNIQPTADAFRLVQPAPPPAPPPPALGCEKFHHGCPK